MRISIHSHISEIPAADWNRLVLDNHPFVRHEFLAALESCDCVGEQFGWLPRHISIRQDDELVGAMPLYEKSNSYGEFVFDNAWADAYARQGLNYFPKLVSAIPYTPATGQRLLVAPGFEQVLFPLLKNTALDLARSTGASGVHWLFALPEQQRFMEESGDMLTRADCQFHWKNRGYGNFEDFLMQLTARKRKNIRQERRKILEAGVTFRCLDGHQATRRDWSVFNGFYQHTFDTKWGIATLNDAFFAIVAEKLPDNVFLVLAERENIPVAGALMYQSDSRLYGRYWGANQQIDGLHFETCYYQGIEHCISTGLSVFEPGAQGEHKIARGFSPVLTRSSHWLQDSPLSQPIEDYCRHERAGVWEYMQQLGSPYKNE